MTIHGWLAAVREMPEEGAYLGQNWADAQDVPGIVPPPTPLILTLGLEAHLVQADVEPRRSPHDHLHVIAVHPLVEPGFRAALLLDPGRSRAVLRIAAIAASK